MRGQQNSSLNTKISGGADYFTQLGPANIAEARKQFKSQVTLFDTYMEAIKIDQRQLMTKEKESKDKIKVKRPTIRLKEVLQPPPGQDNPLWKLSSQQMPEPLEGKVKIPKLNLGLVRKNNGAIVTQQTRQVEGEVINGQPVNIELPIRDSKMEHENMKIPENFKLLKFVNKRSRTDL